MATILAATTVSAALRSSSLPIPFVGLTDAAANYGRCGRKFWYYFSGIGGAVYAYVRMEFNRRLPLS